MQECPACSTSHQCLTVLPCNCKFCSDCLTGWLESKISQVHFAHDFKVSCLTASCKGKFDPAEILHQLDSHNSAKVNEALLKVYMSKTPDIRMCPNSQCSYGGMIDLKRKCRTALECASCGTKWRDRAQLTRIEEAIGFLRDMKSVMSALWIKIFTKSCPNCGVSIIKNGECLDMTCLKCRHDFCWRCEETQPPLR